MALQEEEDTKGLWSFSGLRFRFWSWFWRLYVRCRSKKDEEDESLQQHSSETLEDLQSIHIFPSEIEIEILSRLPVKSLLRCKSICKSWHSLISNPRFVKYHLSLSKKDTDYAHHQLIIVTGLTSIVWCPLYDVIYDKSVNAIELEYPLKPLEDALIVGSCNGLLCINATDGDQEETLFIWNPNTRQWKKLPSFGFEALLLMEYGFGYVESSDDYKVVARARSMYDTRVMVYSLKSEKWHRIGDFPDGVFLRDSAMFSNGALHWPMKKDHSHSSWTILSLDLATETYGEVVQPVYVERHMDLHLGVSGERLCLVCYFSNNRKRDVWVMKDYGMKDSWTKLASIQTLTDSPFDRFWGPLAIANDGKILLHCGSKQVLYDAKNDSSSEIKNSVGGCAWVTVESLVSPNGL